MLYSTRTIKRQVPLVIAFLLAPFFFAHGQAIRTASTDTLQSDLNRLTESLDLLNSIKAGKRLTDATPLQTALNNVISISEEEIRSVTVRIRTQISLTDEETSLQNSLIIDLTNLALHVKSVRVDTTQESGTSAVISIAQKFKEWRDGAYTATMTQAAAFVDIFENEDSIKAANARLASIMKDEKKIRGMLSGKKAGAFTHLIRRVQVGLRKAGDLNARAKAVIIPNHEKEAINNEDSIDEMIRQSNALVNDAYDDFIAMSRLIRK